MLWIILGCWVVATVLLVIFIQGATLWKKNPEVMKFEDDEQSKWLYEHSR